MTNLKLNVETKIFTNDCFTYNIFYNNLICIIGDSEGLLVGKFERGFVVELLKL